MSRKILVLITLAAIALLASACSSSGITRMHVSPGFVIGDFKATSDMDILIVDVTDPKSPLKPRDGVLPIRTNVKAGTEVNGFVVQVDKVVDIYQYLPTPTPAPATTTPTGSATATPTRTITGTSPITATATVTITPTPTRTITPTVTVTPTSTSTNTPTPALTMTQTPTTTTTKTSPPPGRKVIKSEELDQLFGKNNWFRFPDRADAIKVRSWPDGLEVRLPLTAVDKDGAAFAFGETPPSGGSATAWLAGTLAP